VIERKGTKPRPIWSANGCNLAEKQGNNASFEFNALISRKLEPKIQDVAKSRIFVIAQNKDTRP
jgi:hypothetical protein